MSTLDFSQVRAGIAFQLGKCSAINKVYKYGTREQPIGNDPCVEIILDAVDRHPLETAQRMFGHNDYQLHWTLIICVDVGRGYEEAQQLMETVLSQVRAQFDANPQFADPVSGTAVDDCAISHVAISLMRKDVKAPCLCAVCVFETLVQIPE